MTGPCQDVARSGCEKGLVVSNPRRSLIVALDLSPPVDPGCLDGHGRRVTPALHLAVLLGWEGWYVVTRWLERLRRELVRITYRSSQRLREATITSTKLSATRATGMATNAQSVRDPKPCAAL